MKLTDKQIQILITGFFLHPDLAGAYNNIAHLLLRDGTCTVAGNGKIWQGAVGNFITSEPALNSVGCTLLRFDLWGFLSATWVRDYLRDREKDLLAEIDERMESIKGLHALLGE